MRPVESACECLRMIETGTLFSVIALLSLTLASAVLSMMCLLKSFRIMRRFEKTEKQK